MTAKRTWGAVRAAAVVTAALALGLSACGSSGATSSDAGNGAGGPPSTSAPTNATPAVLQFKAPLLAGGSVEGTAYAGKPVAFWFWAPS